MNSVFIILGLLFVGAIVSADDPGCNVIPMSQWAGETSLRKEILPNPVDLVIIQHAVTPEPTTDEECEHVLKAIRNYQIETLGFDDIAESFLVCGNGKVYEGAGWGLVGAHTRGFNAKSIGITFIGEFGSHLPTPQAMTAAQDLIACGVMNNHLNSEYKLVGHRQISNTISPGDVLQTEIETWPHWTQNVLKRK